MYHIDYLAPGSLEELLAVLHQHGGEARVIAGGTDLIPQMRVGKLTPRILVDPRQLPLARIVETDQDIHLGSRVTHTQALNSRILQQICPSLVDACRQVGGPPIRNRGTLAGNVANASPAADSALPLLTHDARVVAVRSGGERVIPLIDFYLGPGRNCLAEDEYIREIQIPKKVLHTKSVFLKLGNRQAMAIAVASVAVMVSLDETGRVGEARIALGSVAPIPLRAIRAEAILQSNLLNEATIRITAEAAKQEATPISDLRASADYRSRMVAVLVRRALGMILKDIHLGDAYD